MSVAIERFEVVPEEERPQRGTSESSGSAPVPPAKLTKQIEETVRTLEARRARLRAT